MSGKSYRRDRTEKKKPPSDKNNEDRDDNKVVTVSLEEKNSDSKVTEGIKDEGDSSNSKNEAQKTADDSKEDPAAGDVASDGGGGNVINIEQMEREKERQARESLDTYLQEVRRKNEWKETLRSVNMEAASNRSDDDKQFYKLDSSLKKNTAFIKKCKTFSDSQKAALTKEMGGLNLSKYIGEVASALVEVKLKMSDIGGMVELCSAIHQKYAEFSACLVENWTRMLTLKKDEKVANPSKMRVDLRYRNVCHVHLR